MHGHARGLQLECLAATSGSVCSYARDLFCRVGGRNLLYLSGEPSGRGVDRGVARRLGFANRRSRRVIGVRLDAEADRRVIDLRLAVDVRDEARSPPGEHDEQTRCEWVERAGVPHTTRRHCAPDDRDDIVRGDARRFVDEQQTRRLSGRCLHPVEWFPL
jgi:hypothetical protein